MPDHTLLHYVNLTGMTFDEMITVLANMNMTVNQAATVIMVYCMDRKMCVGRCKSLASGQRLSCQTSLTTEMQTSSRLRA